MNLEEAIDIRCSRRKYEPSSLSGDLTATLEKLVASLPPVDGGRMELAFDNTTAFEGYRRNYGLLTGVRHYVGLIVRDWDRIATEQLGYNGEIFALTAVTLGLGTCWVGGTFDRSVCPFRLAQGESVACVVAFGEVQAALSFKERKIRNVAHRHTKTTEEMFTADAPVPEWFMAGMQAVQKAPSTENRQPVTFSYRDGQVSAWIPESTNILLPLDFGIAKLHFEIGAGGGTWQWGNHGIFTPTPSPTTV